MTDQPQTSDGGAEKPRHFWPEFITLILACVLIGLVTYIVTRPMVAALDKRIAEKEKGTP